MPVGLGHRSQGFLLVAFAGLLADHPPRGIGGGCGIDEDLRLALTLGADVADRVVVTDLMLPAHVPRKVRRFADVCMPGSHSETVDDPSPDEVYVGSRPAFLNEISRKEVGIDSPSPMTAARAAPSILPSTEQSM